MPVGISRRGAGHLLASAGDPHVVREGFRRRSVQPCGARRDDAPEADWVEFAVDPFRDRRNAYVFMVNSAGVKTDGNLAEGAPDDFSWDGVWEARTSIDAEGWSVEIEIPLSTLRFPRANA